MAIYTTRTRSCTRDYREPNPDSSRVEDLNQGPLDFKSIALNHSATLPPSFTKSYMGTLRPDVSMNSNSLSHIYSGLLLILKVLGLQKVIYPNKTSTRNSKKILKLLISNSDKYFTPPHLYTRYYGRPF